jgi:hypothetical protein
VRDHYAQFLLRQHFALRSEIGDRHASHDRQPRLDEIRPTRVKQNAEDCGQSVRGENIANQLIGDVLIANPWQLSLVEQFFKIAE